MSRLHPHQRPGDGRSDERAAGRFVVRLRRRIARGRGEQGAVVMAGIAMWMLVGGVAMTTLMSMSLSVAQQASMQAKASEAAREIDGALQVGVVQIQIDDSGTKGVPIGKAEGGCASGLGPGGAVLAVDGGGDAPVVVTSNCFGSTDPRQVHRVVLTAAVKGASVTGSAALQVVAAPGGGNDVVVDSWTVGDPTLVTTTTSTSTTSTTTSPSTTVPVTTVPTTTTTVPTTTTSTTTSTTTTVKPTTTTTTTADGVTWVVKVQSDWGIGYCADVTVSNPTPKPIDWKISFPIEGRPYTVWNAVWSQSGTTMTASGADWNRTVQPGGTQPWGFCANR